METKTYETFSFDTPTTVAESANHYTAALNVGTRPFDQVQGVLDRVDAFGRLNPTVSNAPADSEKEQE